MQWLKWHLKKPWEYQIIIDFFPLNLLLNPIVYSQCADFFAKFSASWDADFFTHVSPPEDIRDFLKNDTIKIFFLRD
jgi:hypothetical protein